MATSIPRGGRGGGAARSGRRTRPYSASATRPAPAAAAAVKPVPVAPEVTIAPLPPADANTRHFSDKTFADAPISEASKAGIKHKYLSDVQAATLELGLAGKDLLVQAKTGTGKTMAFLVPAVERLAKMQKLPGPHQISVLVLSPTRELALQIEEEAKTLLAHHPFAVQHAIGGTNMSSETSRFKNSRCDILVATPGRLIDHLENGGLTPYFSNLKTLVLDEADRLLDQGFMRDLEKIFAKLPSRANVPRQAMLFSATMSADIKRVVGNALRPDHTFISTLSQEEANTHEHVEQTVITTPLSNSLAATLAVIREDQAKHGKASKVMVFLPTARSTGLSAEVFRQIKGLPSIVEIHSRKSQSARSKAAEEYKVAKSAILFSSDVAARGMDFPGVTLVIQAGLPSSAEQYIHRLGRTARAGAIGRGVLILSSFENFFLHQADVRALPIKPHTALPPLPVAEIDTALAAVPNEIKAQAYQAWLGYYMVFVKRMQVTLPQFVEMANTWVLEVLKYQSNLPPPLMAKTVGMMNLKGVPGLNIAKGAPPQRGGGGQQRGGGGQQARGGQQQRGGRR